MTKEEMLLETIRMQLEYLTAKVEKISSEEFAQKAKELPEHVSLELASKAKGGAAYNTYKSRYYLQPCGGTKSVRVGGKKCWKKEDVIPWLFVDDAELPTYLKQFGVTIKKY